MATKPSRKLDAATKEYLKNAKWRARRMKQIICVELPDGTYWGVNQYGHTLRAKDGNACSAKLVAKTNAWEKTHKAQVKVAELQRLLGE